MNKRTNDQRSAAEVAEFKATQPDRYFAYQTSRGELRNGDAITTWTGDTLATVTDHGRVFTSNMGDKRQAFTARAINGATYHGIAYLSAGDYVRMRKTKEG